MRKRGKKVRALALSCISLVEIARLASHGRIYLKPDLGTFLSEVERRVIVLPIAGNVALQASDLPSGYPNDPVDRILGATALIEDIPLITADQALRKSRAVTTIW